jgi:hypothetical protein
MGQCAIHPKQQQGTKQHKKRKKKIEKKIFFVIFVLKYRAHIHRVDHDLGLL